MRRKLFSTFVILVIGFLVPVSLPAYNLGASDTTATDSVTTPQPDFSNVNVIVETAWGSSDKSMGVNVFIVREGRVPIEVVIKKADHLECSIELIEGILVKIINPKTGRLLKKYGKLE